MSKTSNTKILDHMIKYFHEIFEAIAMTTTFSGRKIK